MSIVETLKDVTIYGGIISFVLWQWSRMGTYKWRTDANVPLQPPGWVFALAWTVLYGLISASWIIALYRFVGSDTDVAIYALYVANIVLNKLWTVVAGDYGSSVWAFPIIILILGSGTAIAVLLGVQSLWLSFGLFLPYVLWLAVATYWNWYYAFKLGESMVVPVHKPLPTYPRRGWGRV